MTKRLLVLLVLLVVPIARMADAEGKGNSSANDRAVHIVYTERPEGEEPEVYHVRTLTSVLGSEEAAKEALLYSYKTAASGFSAKLTSEQVAEISKTERLQHDVFLNLSNRAFFKLCQAGHTSCIQDLVFTRKLNKTPGAFL